MPLTYSPASVEYRRIARRAARAAIREWLGGLERSSMYLFEIDGVECALEFFRGHWGFEEGARWRWGRVDAGDPDEDMSGENVLLAVALGCSLSPQPPSAPRRPPPFPAFAGGGGLTRAEIQASVAVRARENLGKLVLNPLPPA